VAALYWKRLTAAGAITGVLAAIASWIYFFYQGTQVPLSEGGLSKYVIHLPIGGESYEVMPVVAMITCSAIAMIGVSLITPKPSEATLAKFFS
jgi:SSS family solute:Na+ symporter